MEGEYNMGVTLAGTAIQHSDVPLCRGAIDVPLAVQAKVMGADLRRSISDVHLGGVVRVGTNQQWAVLGVKWEVCNVDVTGGSEDTPGFPVKQAVIRQ